MGGWVVAHKILASAPVPWIGDFGPGGIGDQGLTNEYENWIPLTTTLLQIDYKT